MSVTIEEQLQKRGSLAEVLSQRAAMHPGREAIDEPLTDASALSYAELDGRVDAMARRLGELLIGASGRHVVIALPNTIDYVVAFLACLRSGSVAVTLFPPTVTTTRAAAAFRARLHAIVVDCAPLALVGESEFLGEFGHDLPPSLALLTPSAAGAPTPHAEPRQPRRRIAPDDVAMLQYTSGSTGSPKGVELSHRNLMSNAFAVARACGSREGDTIVTWLPLYHDMGLIGSVLHAFTAGMTVKLMTPAAFVRNPAHWLRLASRHRARVLIAPNFAYDLCWRRGLPDPDEEWDLSHLRLTLNGAEPVRPATMRRFVDTFAAHGYPPAAMAPAYGLAENTVGVSISRGESGPHVFWARRDALIRGVYEPGEPDREPCVPLVGCGTDIDGVRTAIVDPESAREVPEGTIGEIWVTGTSMARGFHGKPEATASQFGFRVVGSDASWLRTGDLGVRIEGQLCVRGRVRDMIVQRGENHAPSDVEAIALGKHPQLGPTAAAFGVDDDTAERVVVLVESKGSMTAGEVAQVESAVRAAISEQSALVVTTVGLVRRGVLPQTTSGKVQRALAQRLWVEGRIETLASDASASRETTR